MALEFVGATSGVTSAALPSGWAPGDIAVVFAYRDGGTTAPTLASGWTSIVNGGTNSNAGRSAFRVLQAGDTDGGSWTGAVIPTTVELQVWRAVDGTGGVAVPGTRGNAASTTVTYPALTLTGPAGGSRVLRFAGHRSLNTALETPPSEYTLANSTVDTVDETASFYSSAVVTTSPTSTAVAVGGTSSGWEAHTIELTFLADEGGEGVTATLSQTDDPDTLAATAAAQVAASASLADQADTLSAAATVPINAALTITDDDDTLTAGVQVLAMAPEQIVVSADIWDEADTVQAGAAVFWPVRGLLRTSPTLIRTTAAAGR